MTDIEDQAEREAKCRKAAEQGGAEAQPKVDCPLFSRHFGPIRAKPN